MVFSPCRCDTPAGAIGEEGSGGNVMDDALADWADDDERLLARHIFGTADRGVALSLTGAWVRAHGFGVARTIDIEISIGAAVGVGLADGTALFVKVWPGTVDGQALGAQIAVQRHAHALGLPAPAVRSGPLPLGPGRGVAMAHDRSGVATDTTRPGVRRAMARGLARLIAALDGCRDIAGLPCRTLPPADAIWPAPHNALFDFAATTRGAGWIDAIAAEALATLRAADDRIVVGHCDWSARNMRMADGTIAVVYDWDSVFLEREAIVVGSAAASFTGGCASGAPLPSPEQALAFVRDHEAARGAAFSRSEIALIAAAASYARAYTARCEHAIGADWTGSSRESLRTHGAIRF
jgi:hypothetical protein